MRFKIFWKFSWLLRIFSFALDYWGFSAKISIDCQNNVATTMIFQTDAVWRTNVEADFFTRFSLYSWNYRIFFIPKILWIPYVQVYVIRIPLFGISILHQVSYLMSAWYFEFLLCIAILIRVLELMYGIWS